MTRGGPERDTKQSLELLIRSLSDKDFSIDNEKIATILAHQTESVLYLEALLEEAIASSHFEKEFPLQNPEGFKIIHSLFLLGYLRSEASLSILLKFLAQDQRKLRYQLHDFVDDDVWEVIFLLGHKQLDKLEAFMLDPGTNSFSKLSVASALVQIGLHFPEKRLAISCVFEKVLSGINEDPDFVGLITSELMDFLEPSLKYVILHALERNEVWPEILSPQEVELMYIKNHKRIVDPLHLRERYKYLQQHIHAAQEAASKPVHSKKKKEEQSVKIS